MAHEKVYGVCENKCFVEVESKENTDAVEKRVKTLETEMDDVQPRVSTLETEMDDVQPRVSTLETRMETAETNITSIGGGKFKYTIELTSNTIKCFVGGAFNNSSVNYSNTYISMISVPIGSVLSGSVKYSSASFFDTSNQNVCFKFLKNDGTIQTTSSAKANTAYSIPDNTYEVMIGGTSGDDSSTPLANITYYVHKLTSIELL